ncbi:hypothetical protein J6590_073620 [Homalodisca vitripennis]|nr:hypothetical protein J6590_073620 [Homalodisca vitripennis]
MGLLPDSDSTATLALMYFGWKSFIIRNPLLPSIGSDGSNRIKEECREVSAFGVGEGWLIGGVLGVGISAHYG